MCSFLLHFTRIVIVRLGFEGYLVLKVCLYRWVLSSDLNLVRLLHILICSRREFHVFGAAYLNDLAANVLFDFW